MAVVRQAIARAPSRVDTVFRCWLTYVLLQFWSSSSLLPSFSSFCGWSGDSCSPCCSSYFTLGRPRCDRRLMSLGGTGKFALQQDVTWL